MDRPGGITPVDGSQNNDTIISLGRFAVNEHNKKEVMQNAVLEFVKVVNAKEQVVAGMMYYITLEAKDGERKKVYEAKVWVKPWLNFKELQEFNLIGDAPSVDPVATGS
ncbi:Proteinase inhibitor I25, cystatin, conserved site [Sesbania bispinosa]|nr:Proteinase inhibitor I25, cystatin, conserved site [Sesbania bispinosa]